MWDDLFANRPVRLLYITGRGFDLRAQSVLRELVRSVEYSQPKIDKATLLLVEFSAYHISEELRSLTEENGKALAEIFKPIGSVVSESFNANSAGESDIGPTSLLRMAAQKILNQIDEYTDIVLDVSSLPRVAYLAIMTGILKKILPDLQRSNALYAGGVNFQVVVAEDALLDANIRSEDPRSDLTLIPGFSEILHSEAASEWPSVWFPILGERRASQFEKVWDYIPPSAEICPVLPHPSRDHRRADQLLVEYRELLFERADTPRSNILYAHEAQPFEAYRQLLNAMIRYKESLGVLGGCRLLVTPLASKLITLGAGLACFEMQAKADQNSCGVAMPYVEPTRYSTSMERVRAAKPLVSALLLTGHAYDPSTLEKIQS
ncbi:hypothetical protein LJ725_26600 [Reyranella aquatilis]|uniref:CRISPR system ring nuclease SSO1393-like domain-containing protein n=2 Tax=Reyranella aquatilis TaxID=2035356 RepID=A0ABS8L445_9HYPH|nr:hypothetical protein [Reyranella aquatilis]